MARLSEDDPELGVFKKWKSTCDQRKCPENASERAFKKAAESQGSFCGLSFVFECVVVYVFLGARRTLSQKNPTNGVNQANVYSHKEVCGI